LEGLVFLAAKQLPKKVSTCCKQQRGNIMRIEKLTQTSMDWFKGKSTEKHLYLICKTNQFFVDFPFNQSIEDCE